MLMSTRWSPFFWAGRWLENRSRFEQSWRLGPSSSPSSSLYRTRLQNRNGRLASLRELIRQCFPDRFTHELVFLCVELLRQRQCVTVAQLRQCFQYVRSEERRVGKECRS